MAQPGDDVLAGIAHLNLVHQIALGKYGAAGGNVGGLCGREGNLAEVFHFHPQPMGLAGEERASAGGAQGVHGVVHRNAIGHADDLGVLTADFQDGAHVWMQVSSAHRMGGNLVLDHRCPKHGPYQPSGAAGGAGTHNGQLLGRVFRLKRIQLLFQLASHPLAGLHRIAFRPQVAAGHDGAILVYHHAFGGDGSDVYAKIGFLHRRVPFCFFMASMS